MAVYNEVKPTRIFIGKLDYNSDLLEQLTDICQQQNIRLGKVEAIGAVQKATIGYYNQKTKEYQFRQIDKNLEITNLTGNVSLKDGKPIVHAHITLSDDKGNAFGGHLAKGTIIFACEFIIQALEGTEYHRGYDEQTGLPLWDI